MEQRAFESLVRRLESSSERNPHAYTIRVAAIAALGYAYIGMVLAVLLAMTGGVIAIVIQGHAGALWKLIVALLVAVGYILKAMWVKFSPPEGHRLKRAQAPKLFAEAESIASKLEAPQAQVVLLSDDFNASVSQVPQLGILGFSYNYLTIGAQLLAALPAEHVRAVLAHEFAHLSGAHGKVGAWIYRVRATWTRLLSELEHDEHWSAGIFRKFFSWYVPYFSAHAFVLIRRHEYEADRLAAAVVGPRAMAQALVDLESRAAFMDAGFWPAVWRRTADSAEPPPAVYEWLRDTTKDVDAGVAAVSFLPQLLKREPEAHETHPSLRQRIHSLLGDEATQLTPSPVFQDSALDSYIADQALVQKLSDDWYRAVAGKWKQRNRELQAARDGLEALSKREPGSLTDEEWLQFAAWQEEIQGPAKALTEYLAVVEARPQLIVAAFHTGRLLLNLDDDTGLKYMRLVMEKMPRATVAACEQAIAFLARAGRTDEIEEFRAAGQKEFDTQQAARAERAQITVKDEFIPSTFPVEALAPVIAQLDGFKRVSKAWLVRKRVKHLADESPMDAVVVYIEWPTVALRSESAPKAAAAQIAKGLVAPDGLDIFVLTEAHADLVKPIKKAGALVYDASARRSERKNAK